jgi:hypothetical protein
LTAKQINGKNNSNTEIKLTMRETNSKTNITEAILSIRGHAFEFVEQK